MLYVCYRDMLPIFQNVDALKSLENVLVSHVKSLPQVDVVVGLEARGFLLAPIVATRCGLPLVVVRKKGKLPGSTKSVTFTLEYGEVCLMIAESCTCVVGNFMINTFFYQICRTHLKSRIPVCLLYTSPSPRD